MISQGPSQCRSLEDIREHAFAADEGEGSTVVLLLQSGGCDVRDGRIVMTLGSASLLEFWGRG